MADELTSSAPTGGGETAKIKGFVKKNKTLVIVAGLGGIWYFIKRNKEGGGSEEAASVSEGEFSEEGATPLNEQNSVNAREESEEMIRRGEEEAGERTSEREEAANQREAEAKEREEEVRQLEEETSANTPADNAPENAPEAGEPTFSPPSEPTVSTPKSGSWSVHGREFSGATSGRIAATGKQGEKAYVEYAVTFPGRIEHWRYFTGSGNWEQVNNSASGAGANSSGSTAAKSATTVATGKTGASIAAAQVAAPAPPQNDPANPNAVNTGNKCLGGGVGGHTAPAGYHLYCGPGNYVWRAPNVSGGGIGNPSGPAPGGGGGGGGSGSGGGGGSASCPAGTVANIQNARSEVNRLQGEIDSLNNNISAHPNAKERGAWESNRTSKQQKRDEFQGAVDRGRAQPNCGNV